MNHPATVTARACALSLVGLAAAVLLRRLLDPVLGETLPLVTLFTAIGFAVWIGGYRPALLVAALGYFACHFLFIQPRGQLGLSEPRNLVAMVLFLATASIIIFFGDAHYRARHQYQSRDKGASRRADLLHSTPDSFGHGLITTDCDGRITSMNTVAEGLTGWTSAEAAGVPLTKVFCIVSRPTSLELGNPASQAGKDGGIAALVNYNFLIAKDGTERPIENCATPIPFVQGRASGGIFVFREIIKRHPAESEQRVVQEQIATTLESVTDGLMRYDCEWRIVYVNAEAERINRLPRSEMLGRILWEVFPSLIGTEFEAEFRRAVADRVTVEFENFYEPFGRWFSLKGYPTDDGGLTTFIRDITEQKFHFEALRRSEARLRRVFESNVVGMIRWDLDRSLILEANDTFLQKTGYTREDVSAGRLNFRDMTPSEWTLRNEEGIREIREGGYARPYEKEYFRKDGSRISFIIAGTRFEDSPSEGMSILIDISASKRAEQEIVHLAAESERQRRLYETVLTNTPDFMYVFSLDHKVLFANDALIKMWGRGYEGAIGRTFLEIGYEPWHADMHDREIDQVRTTRQPIRGEVPFHGTNGLRHYDYIFVPVIGADGQIEAVAGTTRDVTEKKRTEDQLRRNHDTFFALIQNNPFGVYVVDADFRLRQVSLGAQKVFETVRPLLGRDFDEVLRTLWPEPFVSETVARFRHTLETGEPYSAPSTIERRADLGVVESYDWRIERISLPDGRHGVVCYFYDLSERQKWEATLLDSEERLRLATNAAELGIWTWQPEGDIVVWENARPYEIFGLPRTEPPLTAALFKATFLYPEDLATFETAFGRAIQKQEPLLYECRIRRRDAQIRWIEFTGRVVDGEQRLRLIGTVQDITDRKQSEEAIRVSEAKHSFTVNLADTIRPLSDPIAVQAEASRILGERLGANRVVYFEVQGEDYVVEQDYTNASASIVGHYPIASFGPEQLALYRDGCTATEADVEGRSSRPAREKEAFAAMQIKSYIGVPLVKGGVLVAGLAVHSSTARKWTPTDIALTEETAERTWAEVERVRAEAALRVSEEGRRLALDAAELGAFNIDPVKNTLTTDERFRIIFAGTTEPMGFEQAFAAIHPDDKERVRAAVKAATCVDHPAPYAEEYRVIHPDGSVRWVAVQGRANYDREGSQRLVSFDGTVADITARKCIEAEREQLVGQLRDTDRRKDEFLATLAHELRNPLAPLRNGLQVIRMAGVGGMVEKMQSMMERQLEQMVRLVDDLLDVSRVTTGKLRLRMELIELRTVMEAAVETTRPVIEQAGHELTIAGMGEPMFVNGDATRLAQVVSNLLNNSAKYTHRGGHIRLTVRREGDRAVVSVADDGIGIPPNMVGMVFEMFTQVDRTLEKSTGGLGIGLSLVKGLVEMHGGIIEAHSEGEGRGSEFILRLPLVSSGVAKNETPGSHEPVAQPSRRRILVADDNVDSAESLGRLLELRGNEVRTANDGLKAVEVAGIFQPDVIFLDIGMPKLNGLEACRRIRKQTWAVHTILVAMTGWGEEEDKRRSHEAGFDHHLVKPVSFESIRNLLLSLKEKSS